MGGRVGVTVRNHAGVKTHMFRWTNSLPELFVDLLCEEKDDAAVLRDYMEPWLAMKKDWDKNSISKSQSHFEFDMTPEYFPSPDSPSRSEYGLVYVDFVTKTILSSQEYCGIGVLHLFKRNLEERDTALRLFDKGRHLLKISERGKYEIVSDRKEIENTATISESMPMFRIVPETWSVLELHDNLRELVLRKIIDRIERGDCKIHENSLKHPKMNQMFKELKRGHYESVV